jgi:hypothetical protein
MCRECTCRESAQPSQLMRSLVRNAVINDCETERCSKMPSSYSQTTQLETCGFDSVPCSSKGCKVRFVRKDEEKHMSRCGFVNVECKRCKVQVARAHVGAHKREDCPKTIISCKHCGMRMRRASHFEHQESMCREAPVLCKYGCGIELRPKDMEAHVSANVLAHLEGLTTQVLAVKTQLSLLLPTKHI